MKRLLTIPIIIGLLAFAAQAESKTWENISTVPAGHTIRVHTAGQKQTGTFVVVDEDSLRFKTAEGNEITVPRADVTRVYSQSGSHRARNFLIGLAVGAAVGAVMYGTFGIMLQNEGVDAPGLLYVPIAAGGAVGAALPTGRMKLVYDVKKH